MKNAFFQARFSDADKFFQGRLIGKERMMEKEMEIKIAYKNGDEFICNFPEDIIGEALASVFDNAKCVSEKVCNGGKEQNNADCQ